MSHQATFDAIFDDGKKANIKYSDLVSLVIYLGGDVKNAARGSSRKFKVPIKKIDKHNQEESQDVDSIKHEAVLRMIIHEPHPGNKFKKSGAKSVRKFFIELGYSQGDVIS